MLRGSSKVQKIFIIIIHYHEELRSTVSDCVVQRVFLWDGLRFTATGILGELSSQMFTCDLNTSERIRARAQVNKYSFPCAILFPCRWLTAQELENEGKWPRSMWLWKYCKNLHFKLQHHEILARSPFSQLLHNSILIYSLTPRAFNCVLPSL